MSTPSALTARPRAGIGPWPIRPRKPSRASSPRGGQRRSTKRRAAAAFVANAVSGYPTRRSWRRRRRLPSTPRRASLLLPRPSAAAWVCASRVLLVSPRAVSAPAPSVPAAMGWTPRPRRPWVEPCSGAVRARRQRRPNPGLAALAAMGFEGPAAAAALKATAGDVSAALRAAQPWSRLICTGNRLAPGASSALAERRLHALGEPARDAAATLTAILTNAEKDDSSSACASATRSSSGRRESSRRPCGLFEAVGFERELGRGRRLRAKRTDPWGCSGSGGRRL